MPFRCTSYYSTPDPTPTQLPFMQPKQHLKLQLAIWFKARPIHFDFITLLPSYLQSNPFLPYISPFLPEQSVVVCSVWYQVIVVTLINYETFARFDSGLLGRPEERHAVCGQWIDDDDD